MLVEVHVLSCFFELFFQSLYTFVVQIIRILAYQITVELHAIYCHISWLALASSGIHKAFDPVIRREIHSFGDVKSPVEAAVVGTRESDDELPRVLLLSLGLKAVILRAHLMMFI